MSTKVIYTLSEDKPELQKQFGCMNGIFQLFDRRYLLGQRRRKQLPQGESENGNKDLNDASEKPKVKPRLGFMDSPKGKDSNAEQTFVYLQSQEKTSNKVAKEKHRVSVESSRNSFSSSCSSLDCSKRVQTELSSFCPSMVSEPSTPSSQPEPEPEPADIRDVVKDSMTRKPRAVPVKTVAKDGRKGPAMTHVDSPRPLQLPKPVPYDRKDQNLATLRDISRGVGVKETSRFSCDGRESPYKRKSISKELPRLSLDSRQSSIRRNESQRLLLARETQSGDGNKTIQTPEPGSNKRPSSSVVARLMGLEVLDEFQTLKMKPCLDDNLISLSRSSRNSEESTHNNVSVSPKLTSPQRGIMTRIPLEPAPWKQESGSRGSKKQPANTKKAPVRTDHACHSVYGEIEKRLTEVEFKTSGKDLRALKQILEAIQRTKMRLEKKEQDLDLDDSSLGQRQNQSQKSMQPVSSAIKGANPLKKRANLTSDSMVITGLQKVKKDNHTGGRKYVVGRQSTRNSNHMETQADIRTTRSTSPSRNLGTLSPRQQRSKNGIGPSSELSEIRKQSNGQLTVSHSNNRNSKMVSVNPKQANGGSSMYSSDTRNAYQQGDMVSFSSESEASMASQNEAEVTSTYQPRENHKNKFAERLTEQKPMAELAMLTMEQPSPVSVLDAFYTEDAPSPIRKKSYVFKDEVERFDEPEWSQVVSSTEIDRSSSSGTNHVHVENINHLELPNSSGGDSINGDHRYIKEILLSSGLLKNLDCASMIVYLHPTSSLMNPELFNVLEKSKESTDVAYNKRNASRRKMIFDTVNDILVRSACFGAWTGRILNGEKLLKELWSEIKSLQTEADADVNIKLEEWDDKCDEVPGLVLDIERLIFKDLISEVAGLHNEPRRHCRQLFLA